MRHLKAPHDRRPFVFAALAGFTCSICAPRTMSQAEVEAFATAELPPHDDNPWRAVDKSLPPICVGGPTPSPCNHDPDARLHWFLLCEPISVARP